MCYSFRAYDPKAQKSYAPEKIFVSNGIAYYLNENSGELERNDSACWVIRDKKGNERKLYDYGVNTRLGSEGYQNV